MTDNFRSGFVSIIGMPNAGKSTLYNHLLGEALAIVNPKAQTTRHRILGVKNGEGFQIVYSDTPGVLNKTSYKMHDKMMFFVNESIKDSDVLILMLDIHGKNFSEEIKVKFERSAAKKIIALNKIDLTAPSASPMISDPFFRVVLSKISKIKCCEFYSIYSQHQYSAHSHRLSSFVHRHCILHF
jgi:small GTP-binding protein